MTVAGAVLAGLPAGAAAQGRIVGFVSAAPAGTPVPGAEVRLLGAGRVVSTGAWGEFTLPDLPGGVYDLEVHALGRTASVERLEVHEHGTTRVDVDLETGPSARTAGPRRASFPALLVTAAHATAVLRYTDAIGRFDRRAQDAVLGDAPRDWETWIAHFSVSALLTGYAASWSVALPDRARTMAKVGAIFAASFYLQREVRQLDGMTIVLDDVMDVVGPSLNLYLWW